METPFILTRHGRHPTLEDTAVDEICYDDIVQGLQQPRFNGHALMPALCQYPHRQWTILDHSLLVTSLLDKEIAFYGLFHDAHEAYIGDIVSPVLAKLSPEAANEIRCMKRDLDKAIFHYFGVKTPDEAGVRQALEDADYEALRIERQLFMPKSAYWPEWGPSDTLRLPKLCCRLTTAVSRFHEQTEITLRNLWNDCKFQP